MATENVVLMRQAREALKGKWGIVVGVFFLYSLLTIALQNIPKGGWLLALLLEGPLYLGLTIFFLAVARNENVKVDQLFAGFHRFGTALVAHLLTLLFIFLWALLLIVPGIIAALSYSLTFYIIADDPNIEAKEAIKKSKQMMTGHKLKLFYLLLRFLGWALLSILTLGIGFLWLFPYITVTIAKFYEDLKNNSTIAPSPSPLV